LGGNLQFNQETIYPDIYGNNRQGERNWWETCIARNFATSVRQVGKNVGVPSRTGGALTNVRRLWIGRIISATKSDTVFNKYHCGVVGTLEKEIALAFGS